MNQPQPRQILQDRYRLVRELGQGGYGTVWLAEELGSGEVFRGHGAPAAPVVLRRVAIKLIDRQPGGARRFAHEVKALHRLNHPGIVTVHHYGPTPTPFLVMEFVDGQPLSEHVWDGTPAGALKTLRILIQVADALAYAHAQGVVHRDLKPQNILIPNEGLPRIVDFGLSWLVQRDQSATQRIGTPGYLAPELIRGDETAVDHRADIYSLGATLFAAFAGHSPFDGGRAEDTVRRQLDNTIDWPESFPLALRPIVEACTRQDPSERPRTASAVADELRRIATGSGAMLSGDARVTSLANATDTHRVHLRDATIDNVQPFTHATRGDGLKFDLTTAGTDHGDVTGAFVYRDEPLSRQRRVWDTIRAAWPGAELHIRDAAVVRKGNGQWLALDLASTPVLEPSFLVAATSVADVEGTRSGPCATRMLVDLREARPPSEAIVVGSIAHDLLQFLLEAGEAADDEGAFDRRFDEAFRNNHVAALAAGIGNAQIPRIRDALRQHFRHLAEWTRRDLAGRALVSEGLRASVLWGLEGRLDLAVDDPDAIRILELKTGRHESAEHELQLRCYTLLWASVARATRRPVEAHLLYSQTGSRKQLVRRDEPHERAVVLARNDIIALHRWFSDGDTAYRPPSWNDIPELCADAPCRFRRDRCARQTRITGSTSGEHIGDVDPATWPGFEPALVRDARAWYFHFVRLVEREHRYASLRAGRIHRRGTLDERVRERHALAQLSVVATHPEDRTVDLAANPAGTFTPGDRVVLHRYDTDVEAVFPGIVLATRTDGITLRIPQLDAVRRLPPDGWVIDREPSRVGHRDAHRALFAFLACRDRTRIRWIVQPGTIPRMRPTPEPDTPGLDGRLNAGQRAAVRDALRATGPLLIQGPPGTGKTTVIARIARELAASGKRVLLAGFTNTAVDNMVARILSEGITDPIRVGDAANASAELLLTARDLGIDPATLHLADLARDATSLTALRDRILATRVFAATANACASHPVFEVLERTVRADDVVPGSVPLFDVAILDEASQLTEPLAIAAINRAQRFILVGDDKQLPPVVGTDDVRSATLQPPPPPALEDARVAGLDRSLFERLRPFAPCVLLTEQYRMNDQILTFPSLSFYAGALSAAPGTADRRFPVDTARLEQLPPEMARRLSPDLASIWVDPGTPAEGHVNPGEVREIVDTVVAMRDELRAAAFEAPPREWIGIVSPYRAQCQAIRAALQAALGADAAREIEVDTVERFQGREKEAILVSLVARDWSDFVFDPRRLNVTLTRARTKQIVFGARALGRRMHETFLAGAGEDG